MGFLFFEEKDELLAHGPSLKPGCRDRNLCPYDHVHRIGAERTPGSISLWAIADRRHRAVPPARKSAPTPARAITASRRAKTIAEFRADLEAALRAATQLGIDLSSLAFPRNQWSATT